MIAEELIEKYRDQVIKLGFGTAFVYCGKVDDGLRAVLKKADKYYISCAKRSRELNIRSMERNKQELEKLPLIIKEQEKILQGFKVELQRAKDDLDNEKDEEVRRQMRKTINEIKEDIVKLEGDKKHEGAISLSKKRMFYFKSRIPRQKQGIKNIERYIDTYKPLIQREVKEEYPSIDHSDLSEIDMIVVCKGREDGRYWTLKEYEEDDRRPY